MIGIKEIVTAALVLAIALVLIGVTTLREQTFKTRDVEKTKWQAFTASHACEIVARDSSNINHESVTWKCNDGILHTKPASLEDTF